MYQPLAQSRIVGASYANSTKYKRGSQCIDMFLTTFIQSFDLDILFHTHLPSFIEAVYLHSFLR
jgi:hypothetical protein